MEKLRKCKYPENGFGGKAGKPYLIDQFGNIFEFEHYYDKINNEMMLKIEIYGKEYYGDSISDIIEDLGSMYKITNW